MKYLIAAVVILLIVLGGFWYATTRETRHAPSEAATAQYRNAEYGYSLTYPATLQYREYASGDVVFGRIEGDAIDGVAEARVVTVTGAAGQSFAEAAAHELRNLCAADGPSESISCTGIDQLQPFTTEGGTSGYVLYLRGEVKNLRTGSSTPIGKGPFFILPMQTGATGSRILVVHPPLNQTAADADAALLRAVAESVVLSDAQPNVSIEEYIRTHLSSLSPKPEVLGGTFYVTALEAHGGSGTVSYEDGHNAYTADFTYTVDEAGAPHVKSFTVRP